LSRVPVKCCSQTNGGVAPRLKRRKA